MQYTFDSEKADRYGKTVVLSVSGDEIEKASEEEVENFIEGMKVLLGAILPSQTTGGNKVLFNFAGCKTPENLKK
ncbi:MAG: hypothetical protein KBD12_00175 [Candidatus Pacebacteria bacterium]|nr:hypothetical protein [Candidatus Paceibacterota bacterium]